MSIIASMRNGLKFFLMSLGVSTPAKKPATKPAPKPETGK